MKMENKWIKVSFKGARLPYYERLKTRDSSGRLKFEDNIKNSDFIHHTEINEDGSYTDVVDRRKNVCQSTILTTVVEEGEPYSDIFLPMRLHPISNMLIALCGGNPVSEYHPRIINGKYEKRDAAFDVIVNNGFVRLDSPFKYTVTDKEGVEKEKVISNVTKWAKSAPSNKREVEYEHSEVNGNVSWFWLRARYTGDDETYSYIYKLLQKYTGVNNLEERFLTVTEAIMYIEKTSESLFSDFKSVLNDRKGLLTLINGTFFRPSGINRTGCASERGGLMNCICLNGTFLFNLPSMFVNDINIGPHFASYLEGGFASLETWDDDFGIHGYFFDDVREEEFETMGYKRLKNIFDKTEEL